MPVRIRANNARMLQQTQSVGRETRCHLHVTRLQPDQRMEGAMARKDRWIIVIVVAVIIIAIVYGLERVSISALPEPGAIETSLAMKARDWLIRRAARGPMPAAPAENPSNIAAGKALFGMGCATCHGNDGRTPTPIGRSMYPRVQDLGAADVQELSNPELFWVAKNGIRLSGMPGFGRINTDEELWQMTYFARSTGQEEKR